MLWFNFDIYTAITLLPVIKKKETIKIAFWGKFWDRVAWFKYHNLIFHKKGKMLIKLLQ